MSDFHRHAAWGRVRRPKNILGPDYTTVAGNASSNVLDNIDPLSDLKETISAVTLNVANRTIQFTTADALGSDVFDGATGVVFTTGFHRLLDNKELKILSTTDGSNITLVRVPDEFNTNQLNQMTVGASGTLRQRTKHGAVTENARFLHLYLDDTGDNSETVQLWGYNYAFGLWSPIQLPLGGDRGEPVTVSSVYVDATFTVTSAPKMLNLPINGIDRVYFKIGADRSTVTVGAAISTF